MYTTSKVFFKNKILGLAPAFCSRACPAHKIVADVGPEAVPVPHNKEDRANGHAAGSNGARGNCLACQGPAKEDAYDWHNIFVGDCQGDRDVGQEPQVTPVGNEGAPHNHPGKGCRIGSVDVFRMEG